MVNSIIRLLIGIIDIYTWIVIINVIISWLLAFKIINPYNYFVYKVIDVCYRLTEPVLKPIRNFINISPLDISPAILILILMFVRYLLVVLMINNSM